MVNHLGACLSAVQRKHRSGQANGANKRAGMIIGSRKTGPGAGRDGDDIKVRRRVRKFREAAGGGRSGTPNDPRLWRLDEVHNAS
jgi:hypothetical protein